MTNRDFRVQSEDFTYGVRAAALILQENQLLTLYDAVHDDYTLPGGAIELGELSEFGVLREIREELGVSVEISGLKFIVENHFTNNTKQWHNIEFYYICTLKKDYEIEEFNGDTGLEVRWLPLKKLAQYNLKPAFVKEEALDLSLGICHIISRD